MGGYIGATAVGLTTTAADVQGDITSTDTTPELILKNTSEEDTEGGREGKITFKGEQSGGEETTLAQIESAHDGTSDDEKGDLIFKTNDGNDGASPTERLRLDSAGDMLLSSPDPSFTITNTTHEDTDGGRESTIVFKGEQSGGELSTLAEIEASHDGTADDEKGDLIFKTNDGSDGASPTEAMRIDSSQNVGIGTSSPNAYANYNVLTIDGTSGGVLDLERGGTLTGEIYVGANQLLIDAVGSSSFLNFQTNSTERMRIDSNGIITKSNQPAFSAYRNSSTTEGLTGTIVFSGTRSNVGGHYEPTTGKFTAPVAGSYQFNFVGMGCGNTTGGLLGVNQSIYCTLYNETTSTNLVRSYHYMGTTGYPNVSFSGMVTLAANDVIRVDVGNNYVYSDAADVYLTFSGFLVG